MPIQNYPRFLTKASKTAQQLQTGLPIVGSDGTTADFNALKVNTDGSINVNAGGGGGVLATSSNQTTQITEAQTSNTKLNLIVGNTDASSNLGLITSNLLESSDINGIYKSVAEYLIPVFKNNTLNSSFTKSYNASTGSRTWNLSIGGLYPWKIVFLETGVEITDLRDTAGNVVLGDYFTFFTTNPIANIQQELIARLQSSNDYFSQIITNGNCHFVAYYSYQPYVT